MPAHAPTAARRRQRARQQTAANGLALKRETNKQDAALTSLYRHLCTIKAVFCAFKPGLWMLSPWIAAAGSESAVLLPFAPHNMGS
jgi:hypothetical protein